MAKITIEQLMARMSQPGIDESDLSAYFIVDEERSGAFSPRLKLNPATVQLPRGSEAAERTAALLNSANWFARLHRKGKFRQALAQGYDGTIVVSEGDSWFQYPILLKDTIDHLMEQYAVFSLGAAGDLLGRMADKQEYLKALEETGADILLLSGGGNDLVASGALASHLEEYDADLQAEDYLLPSFQTLLDEALGHYGRMLTQVHTDFPHVNVICHGYDYPVPNKGPWLGKPMESRGIRDKSLQKGIAACMMDQFNRRLRRLAKSMPHVTYIDCRNTVHDHRWKDELHPVNEGYADVAKKFSREIQRIANQRSGPPVFISGPFGTAGELARSVEAPAIVAGGGATGISLHVGINTVSTAHYDGWDGKLTACEADALVMQEIAQTEGFDTSLLLSADATRANVVDSIERAASVLKGGDMFIFSVAAHGGQIPDFNQDEDHDGVNKMDETLCLHDFQLADDELYMLWTKFRAGVRILVVPDTCHSGSMVRAGGPPRPSSLFGREWQAGSARRAMPLHIQDRVWRANEAAYREASRSYSNLKESVLTNPLSSPIQASVLNLGACKDNQFAQDGEQNGAFTAALKTVWDSGRFTGDYRSFRDQIDTMIGSLDQTPQLFDRLHRHPEFIADRPFTLQPELQAGRRAMAVAAHPVASSTAITGSGQSDAENEGEGEFEENDQLSDEVVDRLLDRRRQRGGSRSVTAAPNWSGFHEFDQFIRGLELQHFSTEEFLVLGSSHTQSNSRCKGRNSYPPQDLWPRIAATARVLDHFRQRIGRPVAITNAYRAPAYNSCIGGVTHSQHKAFTALDFKVQGLSAPEAALALRWLRDKEALFLGGIGRYNSFTHLDTRGSNATWPPEFKDAALPNESPLPVPVVPT